METQLPEHIGIYLIIAAEADNFAPNDLQQGFPFLPENSNNYSIN